MVRHIIENLLHLHLIRTQLTPTSPSVLPQSSCRAPSAVVRVGHAREWVAEVELDGFAGQLAVCTRACTRFRAGSIQGLPLLLPWLRRAKWICESHCACMWKTYVMEIEGPLHQHTHTHTNEKKNTSHLRADKRSRNGRNKYIFPLPLSAGLLSLVVVSVFICGFESAGRH